MSARVSRASATPARRTRATPAGDTVLASRTRQTPRRSEAVDTTTPNSIDSAQSGNVELPPYVPLEHPLDKDALNRLAALTAPTHDPSLDLSDQRLRDILGSAVSALTESAGDINESLTERDATVARRRQALEARKAGRGDDHAPPEDEAGMNLEDLNAAEESQAQEEAELAELRQRTQNMTRRMEASLRKAIDFKAALLDITKGVEVVHQAALTGSAQAPSQAQHTQSQAQRTRSQTEATEDSTPNPTVGTNAGPSTERSETSVAQPQLTKIFEDHVSRAAAAYEAQTLAQRYAEDNDYIGFKRMVHYASYLDNNAPPVPNARTWFLPSGPEPAAGVTLPSNEGEDNEDEDEDINIVRERISTKCPITMAPFVDPVTSTKCPHSFERAAILAMIAQARPPTRQPGMPAPVRTVECPVSGCVQELSRQDVAVDPVTVRRIRRVQEAEKRDAEAEAERRNGRGSGGDDMVIDDGETQPGDDIDDIDEVDEEPVARIKKERESRRRQIDRDEEMRGA